MNQDCYGQWLFLVKASDPAELAKLMTAELYEKSTAS
ncbi:MAG: hypothetical protein ACOYMG_28670 [Candidatus Methylumidiphilus sp.]